METAKNSPPLSWRYAIWQPRSLKQAHKQLKRYQGKTWIGPRILWLLLLIVPGTVVGASLADLFNSAESQLDRIVVGLQAVYVWPPLLLLMGHFLSHGVDRLNATCVWCHVVQCNPDGSVIAVLTVLAYRLPFLESSYSDIPPGSWTQGLIGKELPMLFCSRLRRMSEIWGTAAYMIRGFAGLAGLWRSPPLPATIPLVNTPPRAISQLKKKEV